jgi:hypothetical protein
LVRFSGRGACICNAEWRENSPHRAVKQRLKWGIPFEFDPFVQKCTLRGGGRGANKVWMQKQGGSVLRCGWKRRGAARGGNEPRWEKGHALQSFGVLAAGDGRWRGNIFLGGKYRGFGCKGKKSRPRQRQRGDGEGPLAGPRK